MWLSPLFNRFYIIVITSILVQVITVLSDDQILTNQNLIVSTLPYIESEDDFDVTTIYKISDSFIKDKTGGGFKDEKFGLNYDGNFSIEIHTGKYNTIGLRPLDTNSIDYLSDIITPSITTKNNLFQNKTFIKLFPDKYWKYNNITSSGNYCDSDNHTDFPDENPTDCFEAFDYSKSVVHAHSAKKKILTIEWQQQNRLNSLRIIYIFKKNMYFDIEICIYDENNNELHKSLLNTERNITQLTIKSISFHDNVKYKIKFYKKHTTDHTNIDRMTPFSIFQIANYFQTSDTGDKAKITSSEFSNIIRPSPFNVFGSLSGTKKNTITTDSSAMNCLNGGYRLKDRCTCPPGFQGVHCEKGCGPNFFGADCSGLCSMFINNGCRGIYFCTSSYGCTCSTGLTGRFCDEDCPPNTYGANCNQNCSSGCLNKICDRYTGICTHGCLEGYNYKSSNCIEKHLVYLQNPPKLIKAELETISVEINFGSENMMNKIEDTQVKYYKLLWKDSYEKTYHYSKIKLFSSNKSIETINNLEPCSSYYIGVLIIMDDGSINKEDIVFGQYNTSSSNLSVNEYNYQVMAGLRTITITWDKESYRRPQCPIRDLSLTLNMINHEQKNITQTYNNIPCSNHSCIKQDLVPSFEYIVNFTARTSIGDLIPPHIYKVTPKFTDEDVTIKNITAKYIKEHKTISISWKPVIDVLDLSNVTVNTPFTYTVMYKINQTLSCQEETKNNWESQTVHNITNYDILDVIPNSQYVIQVIVRSEDKNTFQRKNIIDVLTPPSLPTLKSTLAPTLIVTNHSAAVKWKLEDSQCSAMNGIFKEYVLELKKSADGDIITQKTKEKETIFNDLKPMNNYELKIFIENNVGRSLEFSLIKFRSESVNDLVIYKMNLTNNAFGLRWNYPSKENLKKFIITMVDNESKNVEFEPEFCLAWPTHYCRTISYSNHSDVVTFKLKAKLHGNLESGETSVTFFSTKDRSDKKSNPPQNLKNIEIQKNNATFQWDIPWIFNGELKAFKLYSQPEKCLNDTKSKQKILIFEYEKPTYNYTMTDLQPNCTYEICVSALNDENLDSRSTTIFVNTLQ